jgi:hypothetical protein
MPTTTLFPGGHVIVVSDRGSQKLKPPSYREDPEGWKKG